MSFDPKIYVSKEAFYEKVRCFDSEQCKKREKNAIELPEVKKVRGLLIEALKNHEKWGPVYLQAKSGSRLPVNVDAETELMYEIMLSIIDP